MILGHQLEDLQRLQPLARTPQRYFLPLDSSACLSRQDHSLGVAWDSPAL